MRLSNIGAFLLAAIAAAIKNPIIPGWNPDASILRVEEDYYIATSSFEYFPGTPIYHSNDLAHWELYSHVQTTPEQLQLYGVPTTAGVWAPTLSYHEGVYYLATMTRWVYDPVQKLFPRVAFYTSHDMKEWSTAVWCEPWGIDPALFHDPISGRTYLSLMAPNNNVERLWGLWGCEVDLLTGNCAGQYVSLWNGTLPLTSSSRLEGPKMFYREDYYYLLAAEGGTDAAHRATIARSRSPEGPFEAAPNNPLLYNGQYGETNLTVQSTGHATFVDTPDGEWYASFIARRNINGTAPLGREGFLTTVEWRDDGWPVMNGGQPITLSQSFGSGPDQDLVPEHFLDDFSDGTLHPEWYQLRTPYTENFSIGGGRNGSGLGLTMRPNVFGLDDRDTPAALLRKQKSLNMTFSATLKGTNKPLGIRQTVGISIYLSELAHVDIGVTGCRDNMGVCIYSRILFNETITEHEQIPLNENCIPGGVTFHIRALPLTYSFGYSLLEGQEPTWIQEVPSYWLGYRLPDWLVFSGTSFAVFASGGGEPWGPYSPEVGFTKVEETYYPEDIPDYDVWD